MFLRLSGRIQNLEKGEQDRGCLSIASSGRHVAQSKYVRHSMPWGTLSAYLIEVKR